MVWTKIFLTQDVCNKCFQTNIPLYLAHKILIYLNKFVMANKNVKNIQLHDESIVWNVENICLKDDADYKK